MAGRNFQMIGTRSYGVNLGLVHLVKSGRTWCLVTVDENKRIEEVLFRGSRAKAAQEAAKMTGRLPYWWYEVVIDLKCVIVRVTPAQVSRIAKLSYSEMVALNALLTEKGVEALDRFLDKVA